MVDQLLPPSHERASSYTQSDINFLTPTRFVFVIDTPELNNISYNCQTVNIPSLTTQRIEVPYRQMTAHMTGTSIEFSPFSARFIIDENLENYELIYNWMIGQMLPKDGHKERQNKDEVGQKTDVTLLIYNNNNVANVRIRMASCFPTSLSPVEFLVTQTSTEYLYADIEFSLDYYLVERL